MQDVTNQLADFDRMPPGELADRYRELHRQPCRTRHRTYLIHKIAWRIQAKAEGDLSERASVTCFACTCRRHLCCRW
jgi:hypothetical protein